MNKVNKKLKSGNVVLKKESVRSELTVQLTKQSVMKIADVLGVKKEDVDVKKSMFRFEVLHPQKKYKIIIEIFSNLNDGQKKGTLVNIISPLGVSQIIYLTGVVLSKELNEVIFFTEEKTTVSGFIVSREAAFNTYIHLQKKMLRDDISKINPFLVSAFVQLGLVEHKLSPQKAR